MCATGPSSLQTWLCRTSRDSPCAASPGAALPISSSLYSLTCSPPESHSFSSYTCVFFQFLLVTFLSSPMSPFLSSSSLRIPRPHLRCILALIQLLRAALHNGGGTGWGEAVNGGFGLVLDGTPEVDFKIRVHPSSSPSLSSSSSLLPLFSSSPSSHPHLTLECAHVGCLERRDTSRVEWQRQRAVDHHRSATEGPRTSGHHGQCRRSHALG